MALKVLGFNFIKSKRGTTYKLDSKKTKPTSKFRALLTLVSAAALTFPVAIANGFEPEPGGGGPSSQPDVPDVEHEKRQGAEHRLTAFGTDLLGDGIDPHQGSISFTTVDVSIPGNFALPVMVERTRSQGLYYDDHVQVEFGDWQIKAPRLHVLSRRGHPWVGNRCSETIGQNMNSFQHGTNGTFWHPYEYSNGLKMTIPGESDREVLSTVYTGSPYPAAAEHVTNDGWYFTCIGGTANGQGFLGHAPDGSKYQFNKFSTNDAAVMGNLGGGASMPRMRNTIAASRVTDVHGNTVDYTYDSLARLTRIQASDGRRIDLAYSGSAKKISSVTANPGTGDARTWTYGYQAKSYNSVLAGYNQTIAASLVSVTQPDGRAWSYDFAGMAVDAGLGDFCPQDEQTISVTHPYGTSGVFTLAQRKHRPSYNQITPDVNSCPGEGGIGNTGSAGVNYKMLTVDSMSTTRKVLSGQGLASHTWNYTYESDLGPQNSSGHDRTNWTQVTEPDGRVIKYFHYWTAENLGGKLARQEIWSNGALMNKTTYDYQQEARIGVSVLQPGSSPRSSTYPTHTTKTTLLQDGSTYETRNTYNITRTNPSYSWGQPISTVQNPNFGGTQTVTTQYEHNLTKWILGRVKATSFQGASWEQLFYDSYGRVTEYRKHGDRLATYTYHSATGRKGALNRFRSYKTSSTYDDTFFPSYYRGTPTQVNRPDSSSISRSIDGNGWVKSATDGRGKTTFYSYDDMGRLTLINRPDNWVSTTIAYNFSNSGAVQTVNKGNARTTVNYDTMFRPTLVRSQAIDTNWSSYLKTTYDLAGQTAFTSLPSASSNPTVGTNYTYDGLRRQIQSMENVSPNATTQTTYLAQNKVQVTDAEGNVTTTFKQGFSGPGKGQVIKIVQPMGVNTVLHRDTYGRVHRVQQYGNHNGFNLNKSQYFYFDGNHNICRSRTPEGGDMLSTTNLAGQITSYSKGHGYGTNCANPTGSTKVSMTYDPMGRPDVTNFTDSATPNINRNYDANGNLTSVNRGSGGSAVNWSYVWNSLNLPTSETLSLDSKSFGLSYLYNTAGQMTRQTLPTGRHVNYTPDGLGRVLTVKNGSSTLSSGSQFHVSGGLSSMSLSNGHTYSQTFTARQQPLRVRTYKSGVTALDQTYSYDALGRIVGITDAADSANSRTYGYDDLGRLKSASGPWGNGSYIYDPLGNLRTKTLGSRTVSLGYDSARNRMNHVADTGGSGMASTGTRTVAYDSRGNVTTLGTLGFLYDTADQPRAVSGSSNGTYRYDGNLRRVKAIVDSKTVYNVFDLSGALVHVEKLSGGGQAAGKTDYVQGPSGTLARITNNAVTYLHNDPVGSASSGTNASGGKVWTERYTPFGEAMLKPTANDDLGGYTGHIRDDATGLNYMQARYQDPVSGRFLSIDPVTFLDTGNPNFFNRYAYTVNDPINMIDPDGMLSYPTRGGQDWASNFWNTQRNTQEQGNTESSYTKYAGGEITRSKGKTQFAKIPHNNAAFSEILQRNFGTDRLSLGNNELSHARSKHNENNRRLGPSEGILTPALTENNLNLAAAIGVLVNTSIAFEDPTFVTGKDSRAIGVNFIGMPTGFGSAVEHRLGVPTAITRIVISPDKIHGGGRLTTIYPLSPQKALSLGPP